MRLTAIASAGEQVMYFVGLPGPVVPVPSLGDLWIAPATILPIGTGQIPANEHLYRSIPVPNTASLRGQVVMFQALVGKQGSVPFRLSTPAAAVLH